MIRLGARDIDIYTCARGRERDSEYPRGSSQLFSENFEVFPLARSLTEDDDDDEARAALFRRRYRERRGKRAGGREIGYRVPRIFRLAKYLPNFSCELEVWIFRIRAISFFFLFSSECSHYRQVSNLRSEKIRVALHCRANSRKIESKKKSD